MASQAAIGFAFDSQRGVHAIGSDRVRPFLATPNGLAFVPTGCDVLSESSQGGEYLRVVRTDGLELPGDHAFNNRIDPQAIRLALRMRNAMLHAAVDDDWQAWALALAERATAHIASPAQPTGSLTANRLRLLDEFIDAGLEGPLSKSPHSYMIDRRVAKARALLRDSSASLAEIALMCGFNSQAHMATLFRQRLGASPGQLRSGK